MDREILAANFESVIHRAGEAAQRAGRPEGSWRLISVTKTVSWEVAAALVELGARDLGENRVQELLSKQEALSGKPVRWHMIGHLQRNKVRKVAGRVELVHSVDSPRLAEEIDRVAGAGGVVQDVLIEVNVSGEESKWGISAGEARELAAALGQMRHVNLAGLMTMAPIVSDPQETRPVFRNLRKLGDQLAAGGLFDREPFDLSMGMTQDFEVAIEEGATLIRVGSALVKGI
ncbi:MAG: YggS family pyridoxal phosphate-dependent enzyme [Planctomycetes bacterium]|nr:YggS family pyridoxal phosphate-dependent enzyme [Planctomycetota bacterium]